MDSLAVNKVMSEALKEYVLVQVGMITKITSLRWIFIFSHVFLVNIFPEYFSFRANFKKVFLKP